MARDTPVLAEDDADQLPNLVTIVGRGVPANYEITVDGEIEMVADDPNAEATVISGTTAEGAVDAGVERFRFSGEMANVRIVDWNGVPLADSASVPTVHVEYGAPNR